MNILILGAAGFIGTNLILELAQDKQNYITAVDTNKMYFGNKFSVGYDNVTLIEDVFSESTKFDQILKDQDIVYHLVSTTIPSTSNNDIASELMSDVNFSIHLFEACVRHGVKKVIFISSGGAVYGLTDNYPIKEDSSVNPITSYGLQKCTIEKLLYLYKYMHGLDYKIIRLSNPYGPHQRPNGRLGVVTAFTYKALKNEEIIVYGDGSVVRDFIFIDDVIKAVLNIANTSNPHLIYNLGCGNGTSISTVIKTISDTLGAELNIRYLPSRNVDVPVNYLDISRYESIFGKTAITELSEGIRKTADFMLKNNVL